MTAPPRFFATAARFRAWLERNAASADELVVGFHKLASKRASMTWPESVDEALCVGWVDGVRHRIDEDSYKIRFTPRKAASTWSTDNIARVAALTAEGRMTPAGLVAFARRIEKKSSIYAYEQAVEAVLHADHEKAFRLNAAAWTFFQKQPPGYRRTVLWQIASAKQQATRDRRLARLIDACERGVRLV